jgi:KUP system potassium uptake protein
MQIIMVKVEFLHLYALVRRYKAKWTIIPALIGCATLMADGFITPPISISSAVEGLTIIYPNLETVPIVIAILFGNILLQQFGTNKVVLLFGPIMLSLVLYDWYFRRNSM